MNGYDYWQVMFEATYPKTPEEFERQGNILWDVYLTIDQAAEDVSYTAYDFSTMVGLLTDDANHIHEKAVKMAWEFKTLFPEEYKEWCDKHDDDYGITESVEFYEEEHTKPTNGRSN